jgi:hypothetical protein
MKNEELNVFLNTVMRYSEKKTEEENNALYYGAGGTEGQQ